MSMRVQVSKSEKMILGFWCVDENVHADSDDVGAERRITSV